MTEAALRESASLPRYDVRLGDALAFSPDDLHANRAGTMTSAQVSRLRALEIKNISIMVALTLIMLVASAAMNNAQNRADEPSTLLTIMIVIMAVTSAALVLRSVYSIWKWLRYASNRRSVALSGPVRIAEFGPKVTETYRSLETKFFLHVGDRHFMIPYEAFVLLKSGNHYTVYYEPATGHLLSIE